MSGGSHDYGCYTLERLFCDSMQDDEMNEMIQDLVKVLHDVEWWDSGDIGEERYRTTVEEFKKKWFGTRDEVLRERLFRHLDSAKRMILET